MTSWYSGFKPRQVPPTSGRRPFTWPPELTHFRQLAETGTAEPFTGLTTDGTPLAGLFPVRQTGVTTRRMRDAAEALLAALTPAQRTDACFPLDSDAWRAWSNVHLYITRHGVCLDDMTAAQRELALGLVAEALSAQGFASARNVMRLNHTIGEITGSWEDFGEWLYWLSLFGTPSADEPWGWQLDGHHVNVNCLLLRDQLVLTPMFLGSEPVHAEFGKHAGTRVFEAEEQNGLALMRALTDEQRRQAILADRVPREVFTTAFRDNFELRYEGIRHGDLSSEQQRLLLSLIETYVGRIRPGHADVKMVEVQQHLGETYFAWM